jgi:hypothetical protein
MTLTIIQNDQIGNVQFEDNRENAPFTPTSPIVVNKPGTHEVPQLTQGAEIDISNTTEVKNKPENTPPMVLTFQPYSFDQLLLMPPKEWLVEHLFGKNDLGMLYGPPGCGKTFVIIDFIISMCTGESIADRFDICRPLNVWYCAGEGISGLQARFKAAAEHHGVTKIENLTFFKMVPQFYKRQFEKDDADGVNSFIREFKSRQSISEVLPPDIVIVDTFNAATVGADENDAKDAGIVIANCRLLAESLSCAVMFLHHTNKVGTSERGSSALRGAMDFMLEIKPGTDMKISSGVNCSKIKDEEKWEMVHFHLEKGKETPSAHVAWFKPGEFVPSGAKNSDKDTIIKEMEQEPERRYSVKQIAPIINQKEPYTRKLLDELVKTERCKCELTNPDKDRSSSNPLLYYI